MKCKNGDHLNKVRLENSLKNGIKSEIRGRLWVVLSKALDAAICHSEDIYYKLIAVIDEEADSLINKDIERTILFSYTDNKDTMIENTTKKSKKLFNILKAYSAYDTEVSYCQGTNYIVSILLNFINSERLAFWAYFQIMNKNGWRGFFLQGTPKLVFMLDNLKTLIKLEIPELYSYFESVNFIDYFPGIFTHYFVTLFSYDAPIEYTSRIIDLFWLYEEKIIFDAIIHLLKIQSLKLMEMQDDELYNHLRKKLIIDVINTYGLEFALPYK